MATAPALAEPLTETAFHCSADWHLASLGRYAVAIHSLMLRVQGDDHFFGSVEQIAEYFRADIKSIRKAVHKIKRLKFITEVTTRAGGTTVYRALTHKEWAELYPGQCCVKRQRNVIDDPSQKVGGVGAKNAGVVTKNAPLPSVPLPKIGSTPLPKSGRQVSEQLPIKRDDAVVATKPATSAASRPSGNNVPLKAAQQAFDIFAKEMDSTREAFDILLWVLYRAATSNDIPHHLNFYATTKANFLAQHDFEYPSVLEYAQDRFDKFARPLLAERCPDLVTWLDAERQTVNDDGWLESRHERELQAHQDLQGHHAEIPVPDDDDFPY